MRNKFTIRILIGFLIFITWGCSLKWTEVIRYGKVSHNEFRESVNLEIQNGLIFLPVTIRGKQYRFLFDSGAPVCISNQLQNEYTFKIVSKGNIIDSDHNKKKVNWVQVDSINIGNVSFMSQTAFVGDFDANPLLKCLGIDGIIGSNLIRQTNWTIDQEQKSLSLYSTIDKHVFKDCIIIPFKTDDQYNIFLDLNIGQAKVKNVLMDYGSNGSISLNNEVFSTLKDRDIIGETLIEKGMRQSGIIGKTVDLNREIAYSDSVCIESVNLKKVMLRTGKTVSIGNGVLSRFRVTIDWNNRNLYLIESSEAPDTVRLPGFRLGFSANLGVYVQSVVENSNAYHKGVRPNMKVVKLDGLNFESNNDFCDYVNQEPGHIIFIELIDFSGNKMGYHFEQTII